jgi:electron transfer flavoprotein beta subunit
VRALVLVSQGLDARAPLEPGPDGAPRPRDGGLVVANPADRAALEWALGLASEVVALAAGPPDWQPLLRRALARGARRAVRVWDPVLEGADAHGLARVLAVAVRRLAPGLVLAGERGLAGATGVLPGLLAAHLGWPCLDGALHVAAEADEVVIRRPLPGGRREEVGAMRPAVVSVSAASLEPRYVSVRRAEAIPWAAVEAWALADLELDPACVAAWRRLVVGPVDWPRPRAKRTQSGPSGLPAAERLRRLAGAGRGAAPSPAGPSRLLEGDPGELADRLLAFLESRGLL